MIDNLKAQFQIESNKQSLSLVKIVHPKLFYLRRVHLGLFYLKGPPQSLLPYKSPLRAPYLKVVYLALLTLKESTMDLNLRIVHLRILILNDSIIDSPYHRGVHFGFFCPNLLICLTIRVYPWSKEFTLDSVNLKESTQSSLLQKDSP